MNRRNFIEIVAALLVLLFVYTALSKLLDLQEYRHQMDSQVFPKNLKHLLFWLIPILELITAMLLVIARTRLAGFFAAAVLLIIFTAYIGLVLLHYFKSIPCSCGGVLKILNWHSHLFFNLFFLLLSILGIVNTYRERRSLH